MFHFIFLDTRFTRKASLGNWSLVKLKGQLTFPIVGSTVQMTARHELDPSAFSGGLTASTVFIPVSESSVLLARTIGHK